MFNYTPQDDGTQGNMSVDGGECSASHPGHFTPADRTPGANWMGNWVGPRTILDVLERRNILCDW